MLVKPKVVSTTWYVTDACSLFNHRLILSMDVWIATSFSTPFVLRSYQGSFNMHHIHNTSSLDVIKLGNQMLSSSVQSVGTNATECSTIVIHVKFTLILSALRCLLKSSMRLISTNLNTMLGIQNFVVMGAIIIVKAALDVKSVIIILIQRVLKNRAELCIDGMNINSV